MPLGIIIKNENKTDEMVQIMGTLQQYVPTSRTVIEIDVEREEPDKLIIVLFHKILFSGNQLTVSRARGAQAARADSYGDLSLLLRTGMQVCFLQVRCYF